MATTQIEKSPAQKEAPEQWRPWPDMDQWQADMMKMFNGMFRGNWMDRMEAMDTFHPSLKMFKRDSELVAELAVPGLDRKDILLEVTRDTLSVSGEYKKEDSSKKDHVYRSEVHYGSFRRRVHLPVEVDSSKVKAELKDGVLRVSMGLAHPDQHKSVKIDIK
ncbi:Hsp20/alpha crystallin family protein [bacterium]|nr:Hsp20/alpha crystallin family protein [bacterium]